MYLSAARGFKWGIIEDILCNLDSLCNLADFSICCLAEGGGAGEGEGGRCEDRREEPKSCSASRLLSHHNAAASPAAQAGPALWGLRALGSVERLWVQSY